MKKKDFINILTERVIKKVKRRIMEGVSDKVYHYTDLNAICKIISSDTMLLQSASNGYENHEDKQPFFMSTTRNKNPFEGYAGQKYRKLKGNVARIEFDGRMLNSKFKGYPIDYWYDKNLEGREIGHTGKQYYYDSLNPYIFQNYSQKHDDFEAEDRVMSYEPTIDGVSKYVSRVDILLPNYKDKEMYTSVGDIVTNIMDNNQKFNVFFYGDLKNFCFQTNNTINNELQKIYDDYETENEYEEDDSVDPEMMADVLVFIVAKEGDGEDADDLLYDYGLENVADDYMWECFDYGIKAPLDVIGERMEKATMMLNQPSPTKAKLMKMFGNYMRGHGFRNIKQAIEYKKNL